MTPTLHIRLFGGFHIALDDEPLSGFEGVRVQSLLAFLLVHRESVQSRQHLAYLLWPSSTESQARTNLRRELHHLRRALPQADHYLRADGRTLQWNVDAPYTLDVAHFEAALHQLEAQRELADENRLIDLLRQAVALYEGDLLPNCYEDWILVARERFANRYINLLEQVVQLLQNSHDTTSAIRYAEELLRYDPLREVTYRHLMRLYALHGDRAHALRLYHTCVTTLHRELEVEPSAATRSTYERLLAVDNSETTPLAVAPTMITERSWRMVGRQREWAEMQATWRSVTRDRPHALLLTGVAGIGKSRLLEEAITWASRQQVVTAIAHCYATEGRPAYAPIVEWLRADAIRLALMGLAPAWTTELARLLPELLVERPELVHSQTIYNSGHKLRLFEALAQVLWYVDRPLLLVIDDLQWCDGETLQWLRYLLRSESKTRLLIAGAIRPEEVDVGHLLSQLLLDVRNSDQLTEIALGPLSATATNQLAEQIVGSAIDADLARLLHDEAEGNALFVVETVRAQVGQTESSLSHSGDLLAASGPGAQQTVPPKIQAVIEYRLSQLSAPARELVDLAAVIERDFTYALLSHASDQDDNTLVRALDELWHKRILREQGNEAYDFSHGKLRDVAAARILRARRQLYHRRVAQAMEHLHGREPTAVSGQIAHHFEQAGLPLRAFRYYRQAAEEARRLFANEDAVTFYTHALDMTEQGTSALQAADLLAIYEGRGLVWTSLGRYAQAIADLQTMCQMARQVSDNQKLGEGLYHLAYAHWLTFSADQVPHVRQYAQQATELATQQDDQPLLARGLTMLGAVDQVDRHMPQAEEKLGKALAICRRTGAQDALVQTLAFLCLQHYLEGDFPATLRYAREGLETARAVEDGLSELRILAFLCQAVWSLGNYADALALLHEGMALARARGNRFIEGRLLNTLGWFHSELGDFSCAVDYDQASVELGRSAGIANVELCASINLGYAYLGLGHSTQAKECLEHTLERVEQEAFGAHKWRWQMKLSLALGEHAYGVRNYEQSLLFADSGLTQALATGSQKYISVGRGLRGRILQQLGNADTAGAELQKAFSLAKTLQSPTLLLPLTHALAHWHANAGRASQAARYYDLAHSTVDRMAIALPDGEIRARFLQSELAQTVRNGS